MPVMIVIRDVAKLVFPAFEVVVVEILRKSTNKIFFVFDGEFAFLEEDFLESRRDVVHLDVHKSSPFGETLEFFEVVKEVVSTSYVVKELRLEFTVTLAVSRDDDLTTGFEQLLKG